MIQGSIIYILKSFIPRDTLIVINRYKNKIDCYFVIDAVGLYVPTK
jgi:hypothetical protein